MLRYTGIEGTAHIINFEEQLTAERLTTCIGLYFSVQSVFEKSNSFVFLFNLAEITYANCSYKSTQCNECIHVTVYRLVLYMHLSFMRYVTPYCNTRTVNFAMTRNDFC